MEKGRCKGCGRPIIWARNITGKMIPLDALANVYLFHESARTCSPVAGVYVSHFNCCLRVNDFSKAKKEKTA
jgi:hypothetical protein